MVTILDGNAFYLRIAGKTKTGEHEVSINLNVIDSLIVNFVRRVRESQALTLDQQGRALAYNPGHLAKGVYGVEMVGYYNGQPWRFFAPDVFVIADTGETEASATIGSVEVYDVTFYMKLGGDGVTSDYVDAVMLAHNADQSAHPIIQEAIVGLRTQVERRLVGAKVTFSDGHTEDVELGQNDQGEVILLLPKETFGKIDGVSLNGEELEVDENGKVDINFTASTDGEYSDTPTVTPTIGENGINLEFSGLRGNGIASYTEELSNDDGGVNTHTLVDDKGNEHAIHTKNGRTGAIGPQGATGVYDSSQQYPPFVFDTKTGQSDVKGMTQAAITNELRPVKRILSDFSWVNKAMHPNTPSSLQSWEGYRTSLAYPVNIGDKVVVDTAVERQITVIVFLTTADQASDWTKKAVNSYTDGKRHLFTWTANANGYVRVCGYTSDMDAYIIVNGALATQEGLDVEKARIDGINEKINGVFDAWTWNSGLLHPNDASVRSNSDYRYSNPVTIHKGDVVKVKTWYPNNGSGGSLNSTVIAKYSGGTRTVIYSTSGTFNQYFNVSYKCAVDEMQICVCVYVGEQDVAQGYSATIERADALVKRSDIESVFDGDGLPDYWVAYLSSKMAGFNAGTDTFAFVSDTHSAENVGNSGEVLHWLTKNKGISKVIHGGDVCCTGGPSTTFDSVPTNFEQMLVRDIKAYDRLAERASQYARFFGVKGNHDFQEFNGGTFYGTQTSADVCKHIKGLMTDLGVQDNMQNDPNSLYYYYDNSIAGIRYIVLDTYHNSATGFGQLGIVQLTWLISTLNSTPSSYKVIVIGHSPASTYMAPSAETLEDKIGCVREMLVNANAKASGTYHYYHHSSGMGTEEGDVPYDFSGFNGEVIAYVHGHTHVDNQVYHEGIPFIGIVCDKAGQHPYSPFCENTEMAVLSKSVGTAKEQAIDVATINSTKDAISMRRVGIGFDRHFHVGVVELEVGQTLTLSPSILTAASYGGADEDSTISSGVWTYKHDYATINASTGVVTAIAQGDVIVFAEDTDHNKEFFHIKVIE